MMHAARALPLVLVLWAAANACVRNAEPDQYEAVTRNPIPRQNRERALLAHSRSSAKSVIIGSTLPPVEAADALASGMAKRWGLDLVPTYYGEVRPVRILVTKKYNVTEASASILRVEVFALPEGTPETGSIILAYRRDRWKAWGREFHTGLPVPFKTWNETPVVIESELSWLREILGQKGAKTVSILQAEWVSGIPDTELLGRLHSELIGRASGFRDSSRAQRP